MNSRRILFKVLSLGSLLLEVHTWCAMAVPEGGQLESSLTMVVFS